MSSLSTIRQKTNARKKKYFYKYTMCNYMNFNNLSNYTSFSFRWWKLFINRNKLGVTFSRLTKKPKMRCIKRDLQMKSLKTDAVYLGGPKFLTKARSKDFKFLQDRLESRVKGRWASVCLWLVDALWSSK